MKSIYNYIYEKFKIDKDTKINKIYLFVIPYGDPYDYFCKLYNDVKVISNVGDPSGFIIEIENALKEYKKFKEKSSNANNNHIDLYHIPKDYIIDDFVNAYKEGEVQIESLKEYHQFDK